MARRKIVEVARGVKGMIVLVGMLGTGLRLLIL